MRSRNTRPIGLRKMVLIIGCMALLTESGGYAESVAMPVKMVLNEEDHPWEDSYYFYPYDLHFASAGRLIFFVNWDKSSGGELWGCDGTPGGARMVKDIAPGMASSSPDYLVAMGDKVYFSADDGPHGAELWRSDGTAEGTVLVADIRAGAESSSPMYLTVAGDTVYFTASDGKNGRELWKSDGTTTGTAMVRDIWLGLNSSAPEKLVAAGSTLFFLADDGMHGLEIWKSDGTAAGTELVKDLVPGPAGLEDVGDFTTAGSLLFFTYDDGVHGRELWKSDGTTAGTAMVRDLYPGVGGSYPEQLTAAGTILFFTGSSADYEYGLCRSDGTASGTLLVRKCNTLPWWSYEEFVSLTAVNSTLFFFSEAGSWTQAPTWQALWKSDGTTTGTVLVKEDQYLESGEWRHDMVGGSSLFFTGQSAINYISDGIDLWRSDGTSTGTEMVAHLSAFGPVSSLGVAEDSQVYLAARQENLVGSDAQLWRSDCTTSGTYPVGRIRSAQELVWHPQDMVGMKGALYFSAHANGLGRELWRSDGTQAGTFLLKDVLPGRPSGIGKGMTRAAESLYFLVGDEEHAAVWRSDGTSSGTLSLMDFSTTNTVYDPGFTSACGAVLFCADDGVSGRELWKTDGTPGGTTMVKDINPGPGSSYPPPFVSLGRTAFFTADDGAHGWELWRTDGTASGTVMVKDITTGTLSTSFPNGLVPAGSLLYFEAGRALWRTDGTSSGTLTLRRTQSAFDEMYGFTAMGSMLFFTDILHEENSFYVPQLWKTDGTVPGTVVVAEFHLPQGESLAFSPLVPVGSFIYFLLGSENKPTDLWRSDGTNAGTVKIRSDLGDVWFSFDGLSQQGPVMPMGSKVFFAAADGVRGMELWKTDGTPEGTELVKDIWPGSRSSCPRGAVVMGSTLYFLADEPVNGSNLWKSDGTEAGTVPVRYVPQGPYTWSYGILYPVPESSSIFFFRDWLGWPSALWRYGESRADVEPSWAGYH